nr:IS110 family transposase [Methyloversatilis thermotolerans]
MCFGIDVSKHWLDIAEHPSAQVTRVDNTAAAIRGWLRTLPRGAQRIACESTGSYHCTLVKLLIKAGHQVFLIDGFKLSRYRDTVGQRAKTDRHDARLIARYLAHEGTDLRPFSLPAPRGHRTAQPAASSRNRGTQPGSHPSEHGRSARLCSRSACGSRAAHRLDQTVRTAHRLADQRERMD